MQSAIGLCEFVETRHAVSLQKCVGIKSANLNCAWYSRYERFAHRMGSKSCWMLISVVGDRAKWHNSGRYFNGI